jgi:hypothetical protein
VQLPHQGLELGDLATRCPAGGIRRFRREKSDGVVAPVIGQALLGQEIIHVKFMNGQEFNCVDAEPLKMRDLVDETKIGTRTPDPCGGMRRETLDVHLVNNQLLQR